MRRSYKVRPMVTCDVVHSLFWHQTAPDNTSFGYKAFSVTAGLIPSTNYSAATDDKGVGIISQSSGIAYIH